MNNKSSLNDIMIGVDRVQRGVGSGANQDHKSRDQLDGGEEEDEEYDDDDDDEDDDDETDEDDEEEEEDDDNDSEEDDSEEEDEDEPIVFVRDVPLLRLENVTQQTRQFITKDGRVIDVENHAKKPPGKGLFGSWFRRNNKNDQTVKSPQHPPSFMNDNSELPPQPPSFIMDEVGQASSQRQPTSAMTESIEQVPSASGKDDGNAGQGQEESVNATDDYHRIADNSRGQQIHSDERELEMDAQHRTPQQENSNTEKTNAASSYKGLQKEYELEDGDQDNNKIDLEPAVPPPSAMPHNSAHTLASSKDDYNEKHKENNNIDPTNEVESSGENEELQSHNDDQRPHMGRNTNPTSEHDSLDENDDSDEIDDELESDEEDKSSHPASNVYPPNLMEEPDGEADEGWYPQTENSGGDKSSEANVYSEELQKKLEFDFDDQGVNNHELAETSSRHPPFVMPDRTNLSPASSCDEESDNSAEHHESDIDHLDDDGFAGDNEELESQHEDEYPCNDQNTLPSIAHNFQDENDDIHENDDEFESDEDDEHSHPPCNTPPNGNLEEVDGNLELAKGFRHSNPDVFDGDCSNEASRNEGPIKLVCDFQSFSNTEPDEASSGQPPLPMKLCNNNNDDEDDCFTVQNDDLRSHYDEGSCPSKESNTHRFDKQDVQEDNYDELESGEEDQDSFSAGNICSSDVMEERYSDKESDEGCSDGNYETSDSETRSYEGLRKESKLELDTGNNALSAFASSELTPSTVLDETEGLRSTHYNGKNDDHRETDIDPLDKDDYTRGNEELESPDRQLLYEDQQFCDVDYQDGNLDDHLTTTAELLGDTRSVDDARDQNLFEEDSRNELNDGFIGDGFEKEAVKEAPCQGSSNNIILYLNESDETDMPLEHKISAHETKEQEWDENNGDESHTETFCLQAREGFMDNNGLEEEKSHERGRGPPWRIDDGDCCLEDDFGYQTGRRSGEDGSQNPEKAAQESLFSQSHSSDSKQVVNGHHFRDFDDEYPESHANDFSQGFSRKDEFQAVDDCSDYHIPLPLESETKLGAVQNRQPPELRNDSGAVKPYHGAAFEDAHSINDQECSAIEETQLAIATEAIVHPLIFPASYTANPPVCDTLHSDSHNHECIVEQREDSQLIIPQSIIDTPEESNGSAFCEISNDKSSLDHLSPSIHSQNQDEVEAANNRVATESQKPKTRTGILSFFSRPSKTPSLKQATPSASLDNLDSTRPVGEKGIFGVEVFNDVEPEISMEKHVGELKQVSESQEGRAVKESNREVDLFEKDGNEQGDSKFDSQENDAQCQIDDAFEQEPTPKRKLLEKKKSQRIKEFEIDAINKCVDNLGQGDRAILTEDIIEMPADSHTAAPPVGESENKQQVEVNQALLSLGPTKKKGKKKAAGKKKKKGKKAAVGFDDCPETPSSKETSLDRFLSPSAGSPSLNALFKKTKQKKFTTHGDEISVGTFGTVKTMKSYKPVPRSEKEKALIESPAVDSIFDDVGKERRPWTSKKKSGTVLKAMPVHDSIDEEEESSQADGAIEDEGTHDIKFVGGEPQGVDKDESDDGNNEGAILDLGTTLDDFFDGDDDSFDHEIKLVLQAERDANVAEESVIHPPPVDQPDFEVAWKQVVLDSPRVPVERKDEEIAEPEQMTEEDAVKTPLSLAIFQAPIAPIVSGTRKGKEKNEKKRSTPISSKKSRSAKVKHGEKDYASFFMSLSQISSDDIKASGKTSKSKVTERMSKSISNFDFSAKALKDENILDRKASSDHATPAKKKAKSVADKRKGGEERKRHPRSQSLSGTTASESGSIHSASVGSKASSRGSRKNSDSIAALELLRKAGFSAESKHSTNAATEYALELKKKEKKLTTVASLKQEMQEIRKGGLSAAGKPPKPTKKVGRRASQLGGIERPSSFKTPEHTNFFDMQPAADEAVRRNSFNEVNFFGVQAMTNDSNRSHSEANECLFQGFDWNDDAGSPSNASFEGQKKDKKDKKKKMLGIAVPNPISALFFGDTGGKDA